MNDGLRKCQEPMPEQQPKETPNSKSTLDRYHVLDLKKIACTKCSKPVIEWKVWDICMNRLNNKMSHEWHVAINQFNTEKTEPWVHWMYEAKNLADEVPRMILLFERERTDKLEKLHQQCSHQEPVKLKENFLSCCLGKRCSECPYLKAIELAKLSPEEIDQAKAWTCATHILTESGAQEFLDTSEGYILTEGDKLYWKNVYDSMAAMEDENSFDPEE
jgi:hypothetical protein